MRLPLLGSGPRLLLLPAVSCMQDAGVGAGACLHRMQAGRSTLPAARRPAPRRRQAEAIAACYQLLPAVHRLFRRVQGEEDDYIAQPKVGVKQV